MNRSRKFEISELSFLKDPEQAALYLEDCLADGNKEISLEALRNVAKEQSK